MPANLPPEYYKAEERYSRAKTIEEKILATQELIRAAPKHKGSEKLLKMLKRRLAKLREELQTQKTRRVGGSGSSFAVKKEGTAQVVLIGMPSSGKSTLLSKLTNARPEIAAHPFTTRTPVPGMMQFENIQIQLVEVPALVEGSSFGKGLGMLPLSVARNADAIAIVVDATANMVEQARVLSQELETVGIILNKKPPRVSIQRTDRGGIEIRGAEMLQGGQMELKRILQERRIHNAVLTISEPITLEELEESLDEASVYRRAFMLVNKSDVLDSNNEIEKLKEVYGDKFKILVVPRDGELEQLKREIFDFLEIVRVYTKRPNENPDERPLVVPRGSTVLDIAKAVHKDFAQNLKFARVWGSTRFPGQQVTREYVLQDKDIVELHIW